MSRPPFLPASQSLSRRQVLAGLVSLPFAGLATAAPIVRTSSRIVATGRDVRAVAQSSPVAVAVRAAERAEAAAKAVESYSAVLLKRELIGGAIVESEAAIKVRQQPLAVYLKFITPHAGREVLYREGRNSGNMMVRQTGLASLLGTMSVDPAGSLAMKETRHPITSAGLQNMATRVADQWAKASHVVGDAAATVRRFPKASFAGYECEAYEVRHATAGPNVTAHRTLLFTDKATGLPIRVQRYDFPRSRGQRGQLIEDYAYIDLNTTRLAAVDFDPANPAYGF